MVWDSGLQSLQALGLESRSGWCRRRELCLDCQVPARSRAPEGRPLPPISSGSVKARAGLFGRNASPSQPSTDAFVVAPSDVGRTSRPIRRRPTARAVPLACRGAPGFRDLEYRAKSSRLPEDPFRQATHHRCRFPESKAPSADGSFLASALLAPCFRKFLRLAVARDAEARRLQGVNQRSDKRKAATGAFGLSPSAQRPTRFCAPACADSLDLPSRAGCSPELGGPRAAHRLLQSSRPASTPCERSEPSGTCLRSDLPPVAHPFAGMASRVASNQGSPGDLSPFRPPRKRPLAARIYPDS